MMEVISVNMNMITVCCGVAVVVLVAYGWRFLIWAWLRPKGIEKSLREQGLNGSPYKILFGDLKEMMETGKQAGLKPIKLTDSIIPRVMPFYYTSANKYGNMFFTWLGSRPMIHVTDPPLIRQVLANYNQFQKRRGGNPLSKLLASGSLIDAEADQWVKHRKIITPAFHVEKLKHMLPAFDICCGEMINKWEGITKGRSCEVDVYPHLQTMTSDVISRTAFGSSYEEGRNIFELQLEQARLVIESTQSVYIPGSQFLPTKRNRRMKEIDQEVKSSIRKIINKRLTVKEKGDVTTEDLLGLLLDSNDKEIKQQGHANFGLSVDEVIEECKLFYLAGQETTANLLAWTMILLGQHMNWQDRARDEVLKAFGDRKPDIDGLNHLKTAVFCGVAVAVAVAVVVVVVYGWRFLNWVWFRPKGIEKSLRAQGLNGSPYKFLFGDLKEMVDTANQAKLKPIKLTDSIVPRVMPFFHTAAKTYGGSIFFTWLGPRPLIHVASPPLIRQILANYNQFQKARGGNPLSRMLAKGLVDAEGDHWVKHRKIITPAFHVEKLKHMLPAFHTSCSEMINKWEEITKGNSCEVDVYPHLQTMTSDVISRTAFGSSYKEGRKIFELQLEQAKLVIESTQSIYIPGSRFLPTKRNRRMKEIDQEVKSSIRRIINKRLMAKEKQEDTTEDLLGLLLDSNDKEIKQQGNTNFGLSIDEVIEECKLFYFAGQETTANLLTWTMILLGQHMNWQDRARDEVLKVFGDRKPDIDGLSHLKIINMILHEVLRLYPPGIALGRMIHEEVKIGNLTIPPGSFLTLHLMLLHHDADIWGDDVDEFNPERFAEGVSKATKGQASYFPFGGGPRICVGQTFAILEAKLALVMILRRFSFELSPTYSHAPHTIITLQPQFGAHLILSEL
ncbi:hypothetical protein SSX86_029217 [Deinandra increscens subsp. villosa]|uniref:Cytochrome P450 n=1 Tax=Deinandra increscens subsp. villosa TaxID=3103831 RepID=A0AAP0GJX7_9ASTR